MLLSQKQTNQPFDISESFCCKNKVKHKPPWSLLTPDSVWRRQEREGGVSEGDWPGAAWCKLGQDGVSWDRAGRFVILPAQRNGSYSTPRILNNAIVGARRVNRGLWIKTFLKTLQIFLLIRKISLYCSRSFDKFFVGSRFSRGYNVKGVQTIFLSELEM